MNPWLNNEVVFKSRVDEIQTGSAHLEGTYELKQNPDGTTVKQFLGSFEPPEDSDYVHVVSFTDCSSKLHVKHYEFEDSNFLVVNEITAEDLMSIVGEINAKVGAFRRN